MADVFEPLNLAALDVHRVDTAERRVRELAQIQLCRLPDLAQFAGADALLYAPEGIACALLDFHEHQAVAILRDQINFTMSAVPVAGNDAQTVGG
ncbi:MAG: hypothetical protein RLZZ502_1234 [Pseudomonadota bacterium]